ncbi:hypothetical protein BH09PSE6_BH09PSE6_15140 [soil metagenome]
MTKTTEKQPTAGSGMHGPAKKPADKGDLYDGNFPPGVKPADAADPGKQTESTGSQKPKADNRS